MTDRHVQRLIRIPAVSRVMMAVILLCLIFVPSLADAQCHHPPCKGAYEITLKDTDGKDLVLAYPMLEGGLFGSDILLLPGQTIYVEADPSDLGPTNLRQVKTNTHPERTLVFNFVQTMDHTVGWLTRMLHPGEGRVMELTVKNPFPLSLGYELGMMRPIDEEYGSTSSCPVMAHGFSVERWREPIYKLTVHSMKFVKNAQAGCRSSHVPLGSVGIK